ncbi:Iav [Cordylochernes scorpioides]|uniref:Iav n=1 Tax=Cordylochernes scorpioides TaxID=51811 RepID=A0ABY6L7H1_9ARAC|nr:Iav [Cordylochernes scorpioides]
MEDSCEIDRIVRTQTGGRIQEQTPIGIDRRGNRKSLRTTLEITSVEITSNACPGQSYLGELPLSWAAACGSEPIYNLLVARGADPCWRDSLGNSVLHVLVVLDRRDMYGYALRHPQHPADDTILNNAGLSPLALACKLGRIAIFSEMLQLSSLGESRRACWRLEARGLLGESLLHVLLMGQTAAHVALAELLLRLFPALAWDVVEGPDYRDCMRCPGQSYLGELPLSWAAACGSEPIYNLLVARGADPCWRDSLGNSVLHVLVVLDRRDMYGYALRHPQHPADDTILNNAGLSPLALACKLGRIAIFSEMLQLSSLEFWRYSNITCSGYPLDALDSLHPDGKINWNSALMIILNGKTSGHLDMLDCGVMQRLLEEKWKTFARVSTDLLYTYSTVLAVTGAETVPEEAVTNVSSACVPWHRCLPKASDHGIPLGPARCGRAGADGPGAVGGGLRPDIRDVINGKQLGNPAKAVFLLSNLLVLSCLPCRLIGWRLWEDRLLSLAVPGAWFFLLFFAGAIRLTGPFITMIYKMLAGDMVRFSIIYLIFLSGFSQGNTSVYIYSHLVEKVTVEDAGDEDFQEDWNSYHKTWMSLFQMTLGVYEYRQVSGAYYSLTSRLTFATFMVTVSILMLNLLIAMMAATYCSVVTQGEREWRRQTYVTVSCSTKPQQTSSAVGHIALTPVSQCESHNDMTVQWAKITLELERTLRPEEARLHLQNYSIELPAGRRAVLVIRTLAKSKAAQRRSALSCWKRASRKVRVALRQCGGKAKAVLERLPSLDLDSKPADKEGQLGQALSQLVFAHNLDLPAIPEPPLPPVKEEPEIPPRHRRHRDQCKKRKLRRHLPRVSPEIGRQRLSLWSTKSLKPLAALVEWPDVEL